MCALVKYAYKELLIINIIDILFNLIFFPAFLLYTLQVAIALAVLSSVFGDFMQVSIQL